MAKRKKRTDVECGWWWSGNDSRAPMLYMASYEGGRCVWKTYLDWFNWGGDVYCRIQRDDNINFENEEEHNSPWWTLEAWGRGMTSTKPSHIVRKFNDKISHTPDYALFGERTPNVSNQGEFWGIQTYGNNFPGFQNYNTWSSAIKSLKNFSFWDSDPDFKMELHDDPRGSPAIWIVHGQDEQGGGGLGPGQCTASCKVACAQQKSACIAQVSLDASWAMAECNDGAAQGKLGCQADAVDGQGECVGLDGTDLKSCTAEWKADRKPCADTWKEEFSTCTADVTQGLKDEKASCAYDYADCVLGCAG